MGVLLALAAALSYGASDFVAGLFSRRVSAYAVAAVGQFGALAVALACGPTLVPATHLTTAALAWGALSGVGNGIGTLFLYRGLGSGRMSVVAPLSAVGAAALPVVVGVAWGERPPVLALVGIVLAMPAIALISRGSGDPAGSGDPGGSADPGGSGGGHGRRHGIADGLLAGAGFALLFIALGRVPDGSGLWPLIAGQVVALATVAVVALATRSRLRMPVRAVGGVLVAGGLGAAATVFYLFAAQRALLSVVAVVTSLYPALTVLAAMVLLREHIGRGQAAGLVTAAAAVTLIALA